MITKIAPLVRLVSQQARFQAVRCLSTPAHFKTEQEVATIHKTSMDFYPVPEGSWQENYNKRNTKWNMMIGATSLLLTVTLVVMYQTGCFYMHSRPEKTPTKTD